MQAGDAVVATICMPKGLVLDGQLRNRIERGVDDSSLVSLHGPESWAKGTAAAKLISGGDRSWGHGALGPSGLDVLGRTWDWAQAPHFLNAIKEFTGKDLDYEWSRRGQAWDAFENEM